MGVFYSQPASDEQLYSDVFGHFSNLTISANLQDWHYRIRQLLIEIGFDRYLISMGATRKKDPLDEIVTNFPDAWLDRYRKQNYIRFDPIVKHCREHVTPIFWQNQDRTDNGKINAFWSERERHGLIVGVSVPLRNNKNAGSINVSFASDTIDKERYRESVRQLFLMIPFALEGLAKFRSTLSRSLLSDRELECLQWAGFGKTSWEIGKIIGCTERTVNFHLGNVMRKLDVCNRRQAVGIALANGIISI